MRERIREESARFVAGMPRTPIPHEGEVVDPAWVQARREAELILPAESGRDRTIAGPAGPMRIRQFHPPEPRGVMLHIHGGGWTGGQPEQVDLLNEALSGLLSLAVVSVDYRLAPEHPYPAAADDCEAAALWVIENGMAEFGTDRLVIGGESAGAHLSAVTLLRLRDRHDLAGRISAANLVFGCYDMSGTPSARGVGMDAEADILSAPEIELMFRLFLPGLSLEERRHPDISPLYAPLQDLPPALFTVGTADHLVDDTLLMAARWHLAGNRAELLVYPDAPHACVGVPAVMDHWWPRLQEFLGRALA